MRNRPNIEEFAKEMRRNILEQAYRCKGPAHIGGALSIVEILSVLYREVLQFRIEDPFWEYRDRFILSKGHGVLAFYAALHQAGYFDKYFLDSFKINGSDLIAHPVINMEIGIESTNGSLGHGLSFGAGVAMAMKKKGNASRVYVLVGDGECEEGSVWEAALFSAKHNLANLTCIVDSNGLQSDGKVSDFNSTEWLEKRWSAFGWKTKIVDGHSIESLIQSLSITSVLSPLAIIAKTTKGKGVSFMENNNSWHHNRITEDAYLEALKEL